VPNGDDRARKIVERIMRLPALLLCAGAAVAAFAQPPIASNPVVTIDGTIRKVQLAPGQGMPYLEVEVKDAVTKVYLGSMRYLMEQDFNPKAGMPVTVNGYKNEADIIAITVTLPSEKKTLKLRDEKGWPLWRGGRRGAGPGPPRG
jgi:hypothetical protein